MMINYQEYVESDIPWIGKIPEHWGLSKIGRHFKLERGRVISNVEIANNVGKYPVYSSQTKNNGELGSINTYDFDGEYVSWTTDGANAGTCFYRKDKFNVTNVCGLISSFDIEIDYRYLSFFLNLGTKNFVRKDINPKLMNDMLSEIPILIVPIKEQKLISQYLDKKTSQIDSLIEKIEKKIELLKEQKTALINQFVTRGINPNIEMKDSGFDWIGEIPRNWNVLKINYLIDVKDGTHDTPDYVEDKVNSFPLVTSSHFSEGKIDFSTCKNISMEDHLEINKRSNVETGDILMSMIGSNIGSSAIIGENNKFSIKNVCLFKTSFQSNIFPNYLINLLHSKLLEYQVDINQKGSGQPFISLDNLRNLKFPLPDKEEQKKINLVLSKKLNLIKKNQSLHERKILLLQEYRHSLISSVVTGKIRITKVMI